MIEPPPGAAPTGRGAASRLRCSDPACGTWLNREEGVYSCPRCGQLAELVLEIDPAGARSWRERWRARLPGRDAAGRSGVWRFSELLPSIAPGVDAVTLGEGGTPLLELPQLAAELQLEGLWVKHLGVNPTGSFKDLGMTVCVTEARVLGRGVVACASTGNTSASMAAYAARAGLRALVLVPEGQVTAAKLAQALDFGAMVVQAGETFDEAFHLLRQLAPRLNLYLANSINPFRLEGQKTAVVELLEQLDWQPPDYLILPGGNLGNVSALGKGISELADAGLITDLPHLGVVQAEGASPFHRMWAAGAEELVPEDHPETRATAIRIGRPANWPRALRALLRTRGLTAAVPDSEIETAKRRLAELGVGCEPASAASLAGLRRMRQSGQVPVGARVVLVLTGHQLKDTAYVEEHLAGLPGIRRAEPTLEGVERSLLGWL